MPTPRVVFVLGIMQRSGTNFLRNLLCVHPECGAVLPIGEDFLIHGSDHLDRYIESVAGMWNPSWGGHQQCRDRLREGIERAVLEFVGGLTSPGWLAQAGQWSIQLPAGQMLKSDPPVAVTKSPGSRNLERVSRLFPRARVLVVVRDGRAIIASGMKSFGWNLENSARQFAAEGRGIVKAMPELPNAMLIRYEDLIDDRDATMKRVFEFVGVDSVGFDYQTLSNVPVVGSSDLQDTEGKVHWKPVAAEGFRPDKRWKDWTEDQLSRFYWVAGDVHEQLGYPSDDKPTNPALDKANRRRELIRNWRMKVRRTPQTILDRLRGGNRDSDA